MLLAADIGNTNIVIGIFRGRSLIKSWKIRTEREKTCDEYGITLLNLFSSADLKKQEIRSVIFSSVVPPLTPVFQQLSRDLFGVKALVVGPGLKTGMPILYENPLEVGADRVVAAVAAFAKYGGPAIVVDFGTATTFDAVSEKGEYLGGAIAPGIQIAAEALYLKTAKLPRIEIRKPQKAIGRTTVSSMQSGLYYGYIGLISRIIEEMRKELGEKTKVISTGGFAAVISRDIQSIQFGEPYLVLEGLRIIFDRNREQETSQAR
ncbi:MAG: type III pantothenate kinase [Candidatus Aminicenantes bacterium]